LAYAQKPEPLPSLAANTAAIEPVNPPIKAGARSLSDMPPLPAGKATLLGGTISAMDHLRDRMILQVFGGGHFVVTFDERTRVYRDGKAATVDDLKNGERVYADTVLNGSQVFARSLRVGPYSAVGQSHGQIVDFQPAKGELTLREMISAIPFRMRLAPDTVILRGDRPALPAELRPGTLVTVAFAPGAGGRAVARQISIVASPGTAFVFSGRVEYVDLNRGLLVLVDPRDNKTYDVYVDSAVGRLVRNLPVGADVTVKATFDGSRYAAQSITRNMPASQ
jgi:hypothetical protein